MNGQNPINPVEALSSQSHIYATKGSSVWLHWSYTYVGDGRDGFLLLAYRVQIVGYRTVSNSSIQPLAKRIGQSGALILESPVPVPFNGRVEVISVNSTIVIHGLQYNDSTYQFSSIVKVVLDAGAGFVTNNFTLSPVISITINGMSCCNAISFCNTI